MTLNVNDYDDDCYSCYCFFNKYSKLLQSGTVLIAGWKDLKNFTIEVSTMELI